MKPAKRYRDLKAMVDGALTEGERVASQNALDRHIEKHGEPPIEKPREPDTFTEIPTPYRNPGEWYRIEPDFGALGRARTPSYERVLMDCITTRTEHKCHSCTKSFPSRSRMWRPIAYNGNHRMHRFCCSCFAPDPKNPPALEEEAND